MRPTEEYPVLLKGLKTSQIIVGALLTGVVIFSLVLLVMEPEGVRDPAAEGALPLTWLLIGFGALEAVMVLVFRGVYLANARRNIAADTWQPAAGTATYAEAGDAGRLFQAYFTATIIGAAGMEAGALMSLVAYVIEAQPAALIAAGVFGMLLALQMPTRGRVDQWLESTLLKLDGPGE